MQARISNFNGICFIRGSFPYKGYTQDENVQTSDNIYETKKLINSSISAGVQGVRRSGSISRKKKSNQFWPFDA